MPTDRESAQRERLDADVLIIGGGPAGLACALHLANLVERHTQANKSPQRSAENVYVLEKARELGAHQLSGAILDPSALRELVPDCEKSAPLDTPVTGDAAYYLTPNRALKLPITPPPLANHGNFVVSLNRLVKWLGGLTEKKGVNIFTQFAGRELLYEGDGQNARIAGVLTEDKGVDKNGKPKDNYTPGYELRAKVTVLAEGPRGSLTKEMVSRLKLDGLNPQVYGIGIKELWDVQPGRIDAGFVAHTLGWPLDSHKYGGGWIYGLRDNRVSVGMVVALEYHDSLFDPHQAFQKFKTHPFIGKILDGGKLVRYGAKRVVRRAQFPPGISRRPVERSLPGGGAVRHGRARLRRSDARRSRLQGVYEAQSRSRAGRPIVAIQRRRQAHLRPADGRLPFRHASRRRSALPSRRARSEYLLRSLRPRIRQSLPVFLPGCGLRNDAGPGRAQAENQRLELRSLQDVRHRRSLPDHQLGPARGRRRPQLRRHVIRFPPTPM